MAIGVAKTASRMSRLIGKQGQNLPGTIGLRLSPGILRDLSAQVKQHTVMVCGTNGKTTVNNLLADVTEQNGYQVVVNRTGANQRDGIAGSFILASRGGKIKADLAFMESDEAWSRYTIRDLPVDLMIITNLFRDQLDRYGEIDTTVNFLLEAISHKPDMKLLVNGDDALCVALAENQAGHMIPLGSRSLSWIIWPMKPGKRRIARCAIRNCTMTSITFPNWGIFAVPVAFNGPISIIK